MHVSCTTEGVTKILCITCVNTCALQLKRFLIVISKPYDFDIKIFLRELVSNILGKSTIELVSIPT